MALEQPSVVLLDAALYLGEIVRGNFWALFSPYVLISNLQVPKSFARSFQISPYKVQLLGGFTTTADINISEVVILFFLHQEKTSQLGSAAKAFSSKINSTVT